MPLNDAKIMANAWIIELDRCGIPIQSYQDLAAQAQNRRELALAEGKQPSPFNVELMVACWRSQSYNTVRNQPTQREAIAAELASYEIDTTRH